MADTVGILLAAGSAKRMGENKMMLRIGAKTVLERSLESFEEAGCFSSVILVCRSEDEAQAAQSAERILSIPFETVEGGEERQNSVAGALAAITDAQTVVVHDGARCFVKPELLAQCASIANETGAAAAGVKTTDTIKKMRNGYIAETIDRSELVNIQTPQGFSFALLKKAHELAEKDGFLGTDECSLVERMGHPITLVEADRDNIKITSPEDIAAARAIAGESVRVGTGYDAHRLKKGRRLILGGETIPHTHGLDGHSDADVLLHAIIDALLGAVASRDIGHHFPCIDEFKDASSLSLLSKTADIVEQAGYRITGIDSTLIMQRPKVSGYIDNMRVNIAERTGLDVKYVSVKATTTEGLGFEGRGRGISAMATVTVAGTA